MQANKSAVPVASKILVRNLIRLKRDDIKKVIGILTGLYPLNKYLFNIGATDARTDILQPEKAYVLCSAMNYDRLMMNYAKAIIWKKKTADIVKIYGYVEFIDR